jgi:uncharacterized protein YggE
MSAPGLFYKPFTQPPTRSPHHSTGMKMKIILLAIATALPLAAEERSTIKVLGVAEERVQPDQLRLSCALRSEGKELADVAAANRELAARITKLLRDQGLGETEIKTGSASFGEHTEYRDRKHVKIGYYATTSISVATDKLELHDKLWFELAKFPEASVSAHFALEERSKIRATARKKALQAARKKAGEMADALEARIGAPLSIIENPQAFQLSTANISSNSISMPTFSDSRDRGPLEPGLISVSEHVEVTFELIE